MIRTLVSNDMKYMSHDPMSYGLVAMPIAMTTVYRVAMHYFKFLLPYKDVFQYIFLTMAVVFVGIILALRMLDEKDEHLLQFYAVSPLRLEGYYGYRGILCLVISMLIAGMTGMGMGCGVGKLLLIIPYGAMIGGMTMLGVSCMAQNKIQGMVLAKALGLLVLLPCVRLLGENKLEGLLAILPWDYLYQIIVVSKVEWQFYMLYIGIITFLAYYFIQKGKTQC